MTIPISFMRRLLLPVVLVSPLILVLAVPAFFYGRSSRDAAADADQALMDALVTEEDGVTFDPAFICPEVNIPHAATQFAALAVGAPNHKSTLSALGFDQAVVNMAAWVDHPAPKHAGSQGVSTNTDTSAPDAIAAQLHQSEGRWCLHSLDIRRSEASTTT